MKTEQLIKYWSEHNNVPRWMKDSISKSTKVERENMFKEKLGFGTAGIRGIVGPGDGRINEFLIRSATRSFAKLIKKNHKNVKQPLVVIGHDNRHFSKEFTMEAASVFTSMGIAVKIFKDNELRPTPFVSYTIPRVNAQGGLIITASHNPKEYNGYKAYDENGCQLLPKDTDFISKHMTTPTNTLEDAFLLDESLVSYIDDRHREEYIMEVLSVRVNKDLPKKIKVLYTPLHGAGTTIAPKLFEKAGYDFKMVEKQVPYDPDFSGTKSSNPEDPIAFEEALKIANKEDYKFILGADPDADRIGVAVNHKGDWHYMTGNEMGCLYLNYMINQWKEMPEDAYVVSTFVSTNMIDRIAASKGLPVYRTPTGFKWVGDQIQKQKGTFILGFEEAIGAMLRGFTRDKDSFQAGILATDMANYYANKGKTLIDALNEMCGKFGNWYGETVSLAYFGVANWKQMAIEKMKTLKKPPFTEICGYTIEKIIENKAGGTLEWHFDKDSWVKFRMSGTEPKFKLYFEIFDEKSRTKAKEIKEKMLVQIKELID